MLHRTAAVMPFLHLGMHLRTFILSASVSNMLFLHSWGNLDSSNTRLHKAVSSPAKRGARLSRMWSIYHWSSYSLAQPSASLDLWYLTLTFSTWLGQVALYSVLPPIHFINTN